jgi:hypothetical protein
LQFYDRSPFCTYALGEYLSHSQSAKFTPSPKLLDETERCLKHGVYHKKVLLFENLGFVEHTDARKISYEEALIFEQIHLDVYKQFGFEMMTVPKGVMVAPGEGKHPVRRDFFHERSRFPRLSSLSCRKKAGGAGHLGGLESGGSHPGAAGVGSSASRQAGHGRAFFK